MNGQIVTFYSFKGGVGRSMALANIGVLLAQRGRRVLMVDWDFEAPGLNKYFSELLPNPVESGLINVISAAQTDKISHWHEHVLPVRHRTFRGPLHLLPAGKVGDEYLADLEALNWDDIFQSSGLELVETLRRDWKAAYDFVLIDSRTGYTDAGGVCVIQIPDIVAPVFTANDQSFGGVLKVLSSAQRARQNLTVDRMPLTILPIPARFDGRVEVAEADSWTEKFVAGLSPFYEEWLPIGIDVRRVIERTKVPHVPFYSFGERVAVLEQGTSDPEQMGYAFETISQILDTDFSHVERIFVRDGSGELGDAEFPDYLGEMVASRLDQLMWVERRQRRSFRVSGTAAATTGLVSLGAFAARYSSAPTVGSVTNEFLAAIASVTFIIALATWMIAWRTSTNARKLRAARIKLESAIALQRPRARIDELYDEAQDALILSDRLI